ncbi:hypothetical protein AVEN_168323-1, partial [Araneus ventricosus]
PKKKKPTDDKCPICPPGAPGFNGTELNDDSYWPYKYIMTGRTWSTKQNKFVGLRKDRWF